MSEPVTPARTGSDVREKLRRTLCLVVIAAVIFIERASKAWILHGINLPSIGKIEVSPIFDLTFTWNRGVSFGALKADSDIAKWALVLLSLGIATIFALWLWRTRRMLSSIGLSLVIGGALGNLVDRVRYGAVVDFLDFSALHFPWIFNVADAGITVGAALLALDFLVEAREERAASKGAGKDGAANTGLDEERA